MAKNTEWPAGVLKQVSRAAYNAVQRARGYPYMTPAERLAAAQSIDRLHARILVPTLVKAIQRTQARYQRHAMSYATMQTHVAALYARAARLGLDTIVRRAIAAPAAPPRVRVGSLVRPLLYGRTYGEPFIVAHISRGAETGTVYWPKTGSGYSDVKLVKGAE